MRRTRFKKKGFRRSGSPSAYKKRLWIVFSEYIRRKDATCDGGVECFTCQKFDHWKSMDAGHYYSRNNGVALFFDERNVHPQCTGCNRFKHGNLPAYAIALKKKYGEEILEALAEKKNLITKISEADYYELIETYKKKLSELEAA